MEQTNDDKKDDGKGSYVQWTGIGIEFCGVIAVFCYMGYRLDEAWHTGPWLLITGFFVGFIGMLYLIIKRAMNMDHK
jgi:F0F1-type ATP synthase assembly protein I